MSNLSSFYPQPVIAGTTDGTFAEGDDPRLSDSRNPSGAAGGDLEGTYPNPSLSSDATVFSKGSTTARSLSDRFTEAINVKDWGAKGDGQSASGSITSGSTTLTITSPRFNSGDVGKGIEIRGAATGFEPNGSVLYTTIASFISTTQVVLADPATKTTAGTDAVAGSVENVFWATDDLLAIQRAICAAGNNSYISSLTVGGAFDPAQLSLDETNPENLYTWFNKTFPKLWWGTGTRPVYFPSGRYAISGPIVCQYAQQLIGEDSSSGTSITGYPNGQQFNLIEFLHYTIARRDGNNENDVHWLWNQSNYNAHFRLENISFDSPWRRGWQKEWDYLGYPFLLASGTNPENYSILAPYACCFGNLGDSAVSVKNHIFTPTVGTKIKFMGHATEYEIVSSSALGNSITITPELTQSLDSIKNVASITRVGSVATATLNSHGYRVNQTVQISGADQTEYNGFFTVASVPTENTFTFNVVGSPASPSTGSITANSGSVLCVGYPKQNGVVTAGGENSIIKKCFFNRFAGAGLHIITGSPSPVIDNCMANFCDVGYRLDNAPNILIKPSGDGNNTFIQSGYYQPSFSTTVLGPKIEDPRLFNTNLRPNFIDNPYPIIENNFRAVFELHAYGGAADSSMVVCGGTANMGSATNWINATSKNIAMCKGYVANQCLFTIEGLTDLGVGVNQIELVNRTNNSPYRKYPRLGPFQDSNIGIKNGLVVGDYIPIRARYDNLRRNIALRARDVSSGGGTARITTESGIVVDQADGLSEQTTSGIMPNWFDFTVSGTTATITYREDDETTAKAHGLAVGDYVQAVTYKELTGSGGLSVPPLDAVATYLNPVNAYSTGALRVKNVLSSSQFQVDVSGTGSTSGKVRLMAIKLIDFHVVMNNETRFQAPAQLGESSTRRMFSYYDKERNHLAGLRVATASEGQWWASKELSMGGTIDSPASRITFGTGAPSASVPNGSLYLRTDGDASTTLYVRAGGTWKPLSSYEA